jgi:hypothetical protein
MTPPDDTAWTGTNADWSDQAGWSNGVPASLASDATIATGGSYTVTISAEDSYAIDALTFSATDATLIVEGTLDTSQGIDFAAPGPDPAYPGSTLIDVGAIGGSIYVGSGDTFVEDGGLLQSFSPEIILNGGVLIFQDTLNNNLLVTNTASLPPAYGEISASGLSTFENSGTINAITQLEIAAATVINSGLIGIPSGSLAGETDLTLAGAFTNAAGGTVSGIDLAGYDYINVENGFSNAGLMTIGGGVLALDSGNTGSWTNTGTIAATDATVMIGGDETAADFGTFSLTGSAVEITGTYQNAGQTLNAASGLLMGATLDGIIAGGTLDEGALGMSFAGGTLVNVALINGLSLSGYNGLTLQGTSAVYAGASATTPGVITLSGEAAYLELDQTGQPTFANQVVLHGGNLSWLNDVTVAAGDLIAGYGGLEGIEVTNLGTIAGTASGQFADFLFIDINSFTNDGLLTGNIEFGVAHANQTGSATNAGTISAASGQTLVLDGTLTNTGLISVTGGALELGYDPFYDYGLSTTTFHNLGTVAVTDSTVFLGGNDSLADLGTFSLSQSALCLVGTLDATGDMLDGSGESALLTGATLASGGTIAGGTLNLNSLALVLNDGVLSSVTIYDGLTFTGGFLLLENGTTVFADAGTTAGTIVIDSTILGATLIDVAPASGTISQAFEVLDGEAALVGDFTLTGDLSASGPYSTIDLGSSYDYTTGSYTANASWVNLGAITISDGASLYLIGDETAADLGDIQNDGGTVILDQDTYENAGNLIGSLSTVLQGALFENVTIEGGTFDQAGLNVSFSSADLDNVAILGGLDVADVYDKDSVDISGTTTLVPAGTAAPAFTIGTNGEIYFEGATDYTLTDAVSLTGGEAEFQSDNLAVIAASAAVTGYGYLGDQNYGNGTFLNAGTIEALGGNLAVNVNVGVFDNSGAMIAGSGGDLKLVVAAFAGTGLVIAENGGIVEDDSYPTELVAAGTFEISAGSQLQFFDSPEIDAFITLTGGTLDGAGNDYYSQDYNNLTLDAGGVLTGSGLISDPNDVGPGTIFDSGTIAAAGGRLTIDQNITGPGTITISNLSALELEGSVSNNVTMQGVLDELRLDSEGTLFSGTVQNFGAGDELVIAGFQATGATFANNELTLTNEMATLTVALEGSFAPDAFATTFDTTGNTTIALGAADSAITIATPASLIATPGIVSLVSGITITDSLDAVITLQISTAFGLLDANPATGGSVQGGGTGTLILSGSIASVNDELGSLEYQAPNGGQVSDDLEIAALGSSGNAIQFIPVDINQPPSFSLPAAVFLEPQAPGSLTGVSLQKSDAAPGEIFTVIVADQFDTLSGSAAGAGTLFGSGGAAVALTGTLADINAMLTGLTISGQQDDVLTLTAADGLGGSVTAGLAADLDLPASINGPATFVATLDIPESNLGISLTDPYANAVGETLGLTLSVATGTLASGTQSGQMINFSGTVAELNADLGALTYTAAEQGQTLDPIGITVIDQHGGTATTLIDALDIGQTPSFSVPGDVLLQSGTEGSVPGLLLSKFEPLPGEQFSVYLYDQTSAIFASSADGGAAIGAGSNLVTLTGSLAAINAELASISVIGTADDTLSLLAGDSDAGTATASVPLDVNIPAAIKAPADFLAFGGSPVSNLGISLTDPYVAALGETLAVTVQDVNGTLASSDFDSGNGTTISFSGNVAQINRFLGGIIYTAPADPLLPDFIAVSAVDPSGGTASAIIEVIPPSPPTLTAPSLVAIAPAIETPIDGISVEGGTNEPGNTPITIDIDAGEGGLGLKTTSGISVTNNFSNELKLVGQAAALNTALSSLVYIGGTETSHLSVDGQPQVDDLYVAAIEAGVTVNSLVPVSAPTLSESATLAQPVLVLATDENPLSAALLQWDQDNAAYVGTLYADLPGYYGPSQQSAPISFLLTGFDSTIPVQLPGSYTGASPSIVSSTATLEPFAPVVGDWVSSYGEATAESLGGAGEGSPVQFTITSTDLGAKQPDQITYIIGSKSGATLLPDRRLTIVFNKPGFSAASPSSPDTSSSPANPPLPVVQIPFFTIDPGGKGDVHLTTFDGLHYDFQAAGEFILAKSTAPGDSYQVQIRLQPWEDSASASVTTEIAAAVGANRVTFDLIRAGTVWVNGAAIALTDGQHYDLGAGTLVQLSGTSWEVLWDSGETLTVNNAGGFLDYTTTLAKHAAPGSVEGLLGNDNGNPASDLVLPDGTVLQQPVSFSQLYTTFAGAWRVTQATSLLDYGPGQSTATFTDLSFPSDSTSLTNIPASVLENAESLVTAAGITSPAAQQAAIEDYVLTGDPAFISADAQANQTTAAILQTPTNPAEVSGLGIEAPETSVIQTASGTTAVTFTVYNTGTSATAQILAYSLITGAGYLSAQDFPGGVLPTGFVTLAAGQNSANFTIDVTGTIGSAGAEQLAAVITPVTTTEVILAPSAYVSVLNSSPVEGTDAQVAFSDVSALGTLTGAGENLTLDLGAIGLDQSLGTIDIELVNTAGTGADALSGLFGNLGSGFNFSSGLAEVAGLPAGAASSLAFTVETGTLGQISDVLSFSAEESNPSGYSAGIGIYNLTITADIVPEPLIHAPVQDIAPFGQPGALIGISLATPGPSYASEGVTVTITDTAGTLAIGTADGVTLTGNESTTLTISGSLPAVNEALGTLEFTGTQSDSVTLTAAFNGGAAATRTLAVIATPPAITAAGLVASDGSPAAVAGASIADAYAQEEGEFVTLTVTDASGLLAAAGTGFTGDGTSTLVFTGTVPLINEDLSTLTYTRLAGGFAPEPITFSLTDPAGETASTTILAAAPTIQVIAPSDIIVSVNSQVGVPGIVITDPAAASSNAAVTATLTASDGNLSIAGPSAGATISGAVTATLVISGSLAAVNSDLASLQYQESFIGAGPIAVSVSDGQDYQATATITATDALFDDFVTITNELGSAITGGTVDDSLLQNFVSYYTAELLPDIFGELDASPLIDQIASVNSSFTVSTFLTASNEAESLLISAASGGPSPDYQTWLTYLENIFSATGSTYTSAQLGSVASDLVALSTAFNIGPANATISALVTDIQTILGGSNDSSVSTDAIVLGDSPLPGYAANVGNALLEFGGILSAKSLNDVVPILVSASADLALAGITVPGSFPWNPPPPPGKPPAPAIFGGLSGAAGLFASAAKVRDDIANPHTTTTLQQDIINFILNAGGVGFNLLAPKFSVYYNLFQFTYTLFGQTIPDFINKVLIPAIQSPEFAKYLKWIIGVIHGDVHLTTFSGQLYDFQAEGEFTLVQSTVSGNSFDVQARLQPWSSGASVSVMTEIGAAVGTDRVTFAINRATTVWVDGQASTLSASNPIISLNGGFLIQMSSTEYAVYWNTGELITVTNDGSYLNFAVALGPNDGANSVQGLLGPNNGAANDFELPDGTVLAQPLTSTELYTTFANAWRITQANSLLDYGAGQTTATFTDTNFPNDAISLADLPAALVAQAASVVAAAGITNPAEAAAAELDYIATGDLSFVNSDGQDYSSSTTSVPVTETTPPPASSGIYAPNTVVSEATPVTFTAYLTGTAANAVVLDWTVTVPDDTYIGTVAFGGTLPSGQVTIAAGQTVQNFGITLSPDILGSLASENLQVVITATDSTPVFAATAEVIVTNSTAEPGTAPAPEFLETSGNGMLLPNANGYVLDLGTVFTGETIGQILLALENAATYGADLLGGSFGTAYGAGFTLSGEAPLTGIAGGDSLTALTITANTSAAGVGQEFVFFYPTDSNVTGYNAELSPIELTLTDTVENLPIVSISNATVDFGTIHVGDTASALLTISNAAATPAAGLDATITALTGDATGAGAFTILAPGATDATDITAGLYTDAAGAQTGTVILGLAADSGTGNTESLASQTISLSGTVLNYATAAITNLGGGDFVSAGNAATLDLGILAPDTDTVIDLGVLNAASGPSDLLEGSFSTSGGAGFNNAGLQSFFAIAAGGTAQALVTLSTGAGGSFAETITLASTGYDAEYSGTLTPQTILIEAEPQNACFAAGTRILTAEGALVRVEDLREGNAVELFSGDSAPIIWIGRRTLDLARHNRPEAVQPILITAGALGGGLPWRDLVVSPDHAMYLEGHLIPAKALLNGFSIRQLNRKTVTYYHVELPEHAVLFAEGAGAESYLETGNRGAFENGAGALTLHPDFAQARREAEGCAPFAESGPAVEAARHRILDIAGIDTTTDPAWRICYENGCAIIESRSAIPGEIFADPRDRRLLGVKVAALRVGRRSVPVNHPALTIGWHGIEPDGRWTNGCAVIPKSIMGRAKTIKITLAATLRYPLGCSKGNIRVKA